jgi:anti-sigma regulatory factor (Ser/Thr protein kinase)
VPEARRFVARTLREWKLDVIADTAMLLTSELVTNAVLHARTDVTVDVTRTNDGVRVAITDGSPLPPALRHHSMTATTGRGIHLLDQLADEWQADATLDGKTVWFTLSTTRDPWSDTGPPVKQAQR